MKRSAKFLFLGALFIFVIVWGYAPGLWNTEWLPEILLAFAGVGLCLWFLFSLEVLFQWIKKRSTQYALSMIFSALAVTAILATVNYWGALYNEKWDITKNKLYSLSDQSLKIVKNLEEKITIEIWSTNLEKMSPNQDMRRFLENYRSNSDNQLDFKVINANSEIGLALERKIERDNTIVVLSESGREARITSFNEKKAEEQITNAIIEATKQGGAQKKVCFVSGHGEPSINDTSPKGLSDIKKSLSASHYNPVEISLGTQNTVPEDCTVVAVVGPQGNPTDEDLQKLKSYTEQGGRTIFLFGPTVSAAWKVILEVYGVEILDNVVLDPNVQPPIIAYTNNFASDVSIVESFRNQAVALPLTSSIRVPTNTTIGNFEIKTFVSSDSRTLAKAGGLSSLRGPITPNSADLRGPHPLGVLIEEKSAKNTEEELPPPAEQGSFKTPNLVDTAYADTEDSASKTEPTKNLASIVVFSSDQFAANAYSSQYMNKDLFLNSINHLAKDEQLIGIRPRELESTKLQLSKETDRQVLATIFLIAGLFFIGAFTIGRRKDFNPQDA